MSTRDEYVANLKSQLDRWNADVGRWEARAKAANEDVKERYAAQLERLAAGREKAAYQLRLLENASADAWTDVRSGVDEAWDLMREAIREARMHFERIPPPPAPASKAAAPKY